MKFYFLVTFLIFTLKFTLYAQKLFLFKNPIPNKRTEKLVIDKQFYGKYKAENKDVYYIIDKDGVSTYSSYYTFISKEQVRESSQYKIKNNYLFGVIKNDSVLFHLEDDKYYFKLEIKKNLYESACVINKWKDNMFIINFADNGAFSPSIFEFSKNKLRVKHFYCSDDKLLDFISARKEIEESTLKKTILDPTDKEVEEVLKMNVFDKELLYIKTE